MWLDLYGSLNCKKGVFAGWMLCSCTVVESCGASETGCSLQPWLTCSWSTSKSLRGIGLFLETLHKRVRDNLSVLDKHSKMPALCVMKSD